VLSRCYLNVSNLMHVWASTRFRKARRKPAYREHGAPENADEPPHPSSLMQGTEPGNYGCRHEHSPFILRRAVQSGQITALAAA